MTWRLSARAFVRFWDVHAWAGVITSLVLYVMFLLGSITLFYRPLTLWEEPLRQRPAPSVQAHQQTLDLAAPLPDVELYYYLPHDDLGLPKVAYFLPGTTHWRAWWLDREQQRVVPQRELAAAYVYDLHYLWHGAPGYWLQYGGGVLVFGFLLALVSGVLIHLKNLVRQLHRFRPEQPSRVFWSDVHKLTGVLGLPFQLVYAITGALMVLSPLLFQLSVLPVFGGDAQRAADTAGALIEEPPPRDYGPAVAWLTLDQLAARAHALLPRLEPESFVLRGYGREHGTVDVRGEVQGEPFGDGMIRLRGRDAGLELIETPHHERAVGTVARWMHGLHTVHYGGPGMRWLLFTLAIAGCATILSGNWVWLARRAAARQRRDAANSVMHRAPGASKPDARSGSHRLLARLTAGVGAGSPVAVAALWLASRSLPLDLAARPRIEELVLAAVFASCVTWALLARDTIATWWRQLTLAGTMLALVPLAAIQHSGAGLFGAGPHMRGVVAVDSAFLALGAALLATAFVIRRAARRGAQQPTAAGRGTPGPARTPLAGSAHD